MYLCETFQKPPSDPFFENMEPMDKLWLFHAWVNKQNVQIEILKDHAILNGAFYNPEMAKQMSKGPDYQLSDEELESSWDYVQSQPAPTALDRIEEGGQAPHRRRRRLLNG